MQTTDGSGRGPADSAAGFPRRLPYLPALDGLRTLALLAVLLDHGGVAGVVGGHFGVTVFFVLSGFLVSALLLHEHHETRGIDVMAFWARRVRRLVPGFIAFFAFTLAYLGFSGDRAPSTALGDGVAALGWLANWRFVFTDRSYGDLFSDPTPFAHVWSLAVEEQFYLVLPVVAAVCLGVRRGGSSFRFGLVLAAVAAASSWWMWNLFVPEEDPARVYYGTDTRIAELAVGALLAVLLVRRGRLLSLPRAPVRLLSVTAVLALAAIVVIVQRYSLDDAITYRGGFLVVALLSALVVTSCTQPASGVARVLSLDPLPQVGRLTYGAYLYHWPLFLWIDEGATGLDGGALLALRLAATFSLALVSTKLLEEPLRRGRIPRRIGPLAWADASVALAAVLVLVVGVVAPPGGESSVFASGPSPVPVPPPPAGVPSPGAAPVIAEGATAAAPAARIPPPGGTAGPSPLPVRREGGSARPASSAVATRPPQQPQEPQGAQRGAPAPAPAPAPAEAATAKDPDALRVAIVGDSLAQNLGKGLERWSNTRTDMVVYDLSVPGCPISRGGTRRFPDGTYFPIEEHCGWWEVPEDERTRRLAEFGADIVLVEDALNELADRKLPEWPDYLHPGDPPFDAWLLSEYQEAAEVFSAGGAVVVYADAPCADWDQLSGWGSMKDADERVAALNRIYDRVVAATTKVADLFDRLCPDGRYSDEVEGVADGRPDGFHLADEAALRLADRWLAPFLRDAGTGSGAL